MFKVKVASEVRGDEEMGPFATREEAERESERLKASGGFSKNEIIGDTPAIVDAPVVEFPKVEPPPVEPLKLDMSTPEGEHHDEPPPQSDHHDGDHFDSSR